MGNCLDETHTSQPIKKVSGLGKDKGTCKHRTSIEYNLILNKLQSAKPSHFPHYNTNTTDK